ncbi:MAG TPA: DUF2147 domain-containing protein [candidate division Zixibacteria bacterium]|nr:DUF2147 domain-containing protein [candidate division Zixibacteria bacterium]
MFATRRFVPLLALVALCFQIAVAQIATSPVGLWKTFDDKTGEAKSLVRIYEQNGHYFGKVEKTLRPNAKQTCDKCKDDLKDKPIVGMVVMRNMKADGDEFTGGDILDPENGSVYKCKFKLEDGGKKLRVRGFIGFSMLGRSQTWERVE